MQIQMQLLGVKWRTDFFKIKFVFIQV